MALAFGTIGTVATGSTSLSVAYPASIASGDLLLLVVVNKYPSNGPSTPGGFALLAQYSGGNGSAGLNSGNVYTTVYTRTADGTESGSVAVTITSGNSACGAIARYTLGAGKVWGVAACGGSDNTAGTSWSVTGDANPGVTAGDMFVVFSGANGNFRNYTLEAITATGLTIGTETERADSGAADGDDCQLWVSDHAVSAGTASAAPVYVSTCGGSGANYPAGASVIVRLRELPGAGADPMGALGFFGL